MQIDRLQLEIQLKQTLLNQLREKYNTSDFVQKTINTDYRIYGKSIPVVDVPRKHVESATVMRLTPGASTCSK